MSFKAVKITDKVWWVGAIDWNLVEALFGIDSLVTRIVYLLVGLSGLYLIFLYPKIASRD